MATRYSEEDLQEFKALLEKKLARAEKELNYLQEQLLEMNESYDSERIDYIDSGHSESDMEMLNTMVIRQRKHIRDLENALLRIQQRTYGICEVSGELIDKRRLLAVPTTTKSLAAKEALRLEQERGKKPASSRAEKPEKKKIITKVVKRKKTTDESTLVSRPDPLDEPDEDDFEEDDYDDNPTISLDEIDEDRLGADDPAMDLE
jgi:RNA polymerase-binding transcription factor DksA